MSIEDEVTKLKARLGEEAYNDITAATKLLMGSKVTTEFEDVLISKLVKTIGDTVSLFEGTSLNKNIAFYTTVSSLGQIMVGHIAEVSNNEEAVAQRNLAMMVEVMKKWMTQACETPPAP